MLHFLVNELSESKSSCATVEAGVEEALAEFEWQVGMSHEE